MQVRAAPLADRHVLRSGVHVIVVVLQRLHLDRVRPGVRAGARHRAGVRVTVRLGVRLRAGVRVRVRVRAGVWARVSTQLVCALRVAPQRSRCGICSTTHRGVAAASSASHASLPISFHRMSSTRRGTRRLRSAAASLYVSALPQQLPKIRSSVSRHSSRPSASHRASTAAEVYLPRPFQLTPHSWFWPSLRPRSGLPGLRSHAHSASTW